MSELNGREKTHITYTQQILYFSGEGGGIALYREQLYNEFLFSYTHFQFAFLPLPSSCVHSADKHCSRMGNSVIVNTLVHFTSGTCREIVVIWAFFFFWDSVIEFWFDRLTFKKGNGRAYLKLDFHSTNFVFNCQ